MIQRRGFLKALAALSAVPLITVPDFRIVEPLAFMLPDESWFASVRETKGYDLYQDRTVYRLDLLGNDRKGELVHLGCDFWANTPAQVEHGREVAGQVLANAMRQAGIDPRHLKPPPDYRA